MLPTPRALTVALSLGSKSVFHPIVQRVLRPSHSRGWQAPSADHGGAKYRAWIWYDRMYDESMGYAYEDLAESQFEQLVVQMSRKLLGPSVQGFSPGVDGGRDARFEATANGFPSDHSPWSGITIIQAKHTNAFNTRFGDAGFSGHSDSSVITEEIIRIKKLVAAKSLDNYMLFSNRHLSALSNETILKRLSDECGIKTASLHLIGIERMDELFREHPNLATLAGINPLDGPLLVSSRELGDVVEKVAATLLAVSDKIPAPPTARVAFSRKNELNNMSESYSKVLMRRYAHLLKQIHDFLADPVNSEYQDLYEAVVDDIGTKIAAHKTDYHTFDRLFEYLADLVISRDTVLSANRKLTKGVLFYMYWNCDIGEVEDAVS